MANVMVAPRSEAGKATRCAHRDGLEWPESGQRFSERGYGADSVYLPSP